MTLLLGVLDVGDSNGHSGESYDAAVDVTNSRVWQFDRSTFTPIQASDPNLWSSTFGHQGMSANQVGSTLSLCRKLVDRGMVPNGYDLCIIPVCWAGTSFATSWSTTGSRNALDGGGSIVHG